MKIGINRRLGGINVSSQIDQHLEAALADKDLTSLRRALAQQIEASPADADGHIRQAAMNIEQSVPELWEEHDGELFASREQWDRAYFQDVHAGLSTNFSRETFFHVLDVGRAIYGAAGSKQGEGAKPWVSIVIVLIFLVIGGAILFGPQVFRIIFSNSAIMG